MDREQLEALRRQVEEDYKLDIAAIERLQLRYLGASGSTPRSAPSDNVPPSGYASPNERSNAEPGVEAHAPALPPSTPAERQRDELEGSIRTIFRSQVAR
jgi:hypothetical protein